MAGVPARRTGWMCECGVKLRDDMMQLTCPACGRQYERRGEKVTPMENDEK
jgi:UDP-2-acetamido-3-amino-2,3-dideoxy-glucuronate N-acetyltransferase